MNVEREESSGTRTVKKIGVGPYRMMSVSSKNKERR